MTELHWSTNFVGIPFAELGRTRQGADCWGLVRLVFQERLRIELPAYSEAYHSVAEKERIAAHIASVATGREWRRVQSPEPFDILVFRAGRYHSHVGLAIGGKQMLHMAEEESARIDTIASPRWASRLTGIFRHNGA
jgi:cell wall-associated NlpC family hydrolase